MEYGSGLFLGEEYLDTVTIGSLVIENQSIGDAFIAFGFDDVDGILGYIFMISTCSHTHDFQSRTRWSYCGDVVPGFLIIHTYR